QDSVVAVDPVSDETLLQIGDFVRVTDPYQQIEVVRLLLIPPHPVETLASHHQRALANGSDKEERTLDLLVAGRERDRPGHPPGRVDLVDIGSTSAVRRVLLQELHLPAYPLGQGDVVAVHLRDVLTLREFHSGVPGAHHAYVRLVPDRDDPAVRARVALNDVPGAVGR